MKLLVKEPRTLILKPTLDGQSLILEPNKSYSCARLGFDSGRTLDTILGCLGIVSINEELFLGCVLEAPSFQLDGQNIYRISRVAFYSLSSSRYDTFNEANTAQGQETLVHPCALLMKLLTCGSFYFSPTLDLTRSAQMRQLADKEDSLFDTMDTHFVWNIQMLRPFLHMRESELEESSRLELDASGIFIAVIQGFVGVEKCSIRGSKMQMAIISRLSCKNAGTRFNARGINDDGHVSNFVETEFLIFSDSYCFSFLQIRGSVPVFWEQVGMQLGAHKVTISRGPESTIPATRKHFEELIERYEYVQIVNLLGQSSLSPEYELSNSYKTAMIGLGDLLACTDFYSFDFNAIVKHEYDRVDELTSKISAKISQMGYFLHDPKSNSTVFYQRGILRTNCLDCLDRTNLVQCHLAKAALDIHFKHRGVTLGSYDEDLFMGHFNNLWADNADWLSKIYAGTGALKSSYTRKGKSTVLGFLDDAAKSVNRFYDRQEAIDILLAANFKRNVESLIRNPLHESVHQALHDQESFYTQFGHATIFLGTYNINGKIPGEPLDSWLESRLISSADLVIIGVQELIELTPGQYITANTEQLRLNWESALIKALNSKPGRNYVILRSLHLVALAMFAFVDQASVPFVKQVESATIKTGLGGMAANKGGIGISLLFNDTSIVFITAHFAAGNSNVEERNRDYWTITNGLKFKRRKLVDHDMIFWAGDFNYRLNASNEESRMRITAGELPILYATDQLKEQVDKQLAFPKFFEGPISFLPTYKYDNGSTIYDSSEKARTPSWTDRILFKGDGIALMEYARGEQLMSDHRPVRGIFQLKTKIVDQVARDTLKRSLYQSISGNPKIGMEPMRKLGGTPINSPRSQPLSLPPPLPSRKKVEAPVGNLIELESLSTSLGSLVLGPASNPPSNRVAHSSVPNPFNDLTPASLSQSLPPPSNDQVKWWDRPFDESWVPFEGSGKNPFYPLLKPSTLVAPLLPSTQVVPLGGSFWANTPSIQPRASVSSIPLQPTPLTVPPSPRLPQTVSSTPSPMIPSTQPFYNQPLRQYAPIQQGFVSNSPTISQASLNSPFNPFGTTTSSIPSAYPPSNPTANSFDTNPLADTKNLLD